MNSRHVYIGNHYSFPTPSSKYRASAVGGFFDVFHEIFPKYKEGSQYRVTTTSALKGLNYPTDDKMDLVRSVTPFNYLF
jgi:hypothetical protein